MEVLTETVKVIVEKVMGYTIGAVARQMGYLIHFKRNVDKLRNEVVDLEDDRKSVERKVEASRNNVEEIEDKVLTWLKRVEKITEEAQEFLKEEDQAKLKCFNGRCLNLKARYQLGKRAHRMGLAVMEIKDKGTFQTVGHRVLIQGGTTISTKGYEDFKSRESTLNGIMRALKDDSIRAIGVYGMGGVGKTMLVGKIATQAKEDKIFEMTVKEVVSQKPDLEQIQKDIAKELGLSFHDETDSQKADLLRERLKKGKILLIIDDIWNKIDLESRGISFGDDQKGSKLLLTSRSGDVLGEYTDPQGIFQVEALSTDEAEFLFVKIVGNFETLDLQSVMVELVKECAGLPIAITTVANALKSRKDLKIWKDAVVQLKRANPTQIKDMHEKVYSSIKLSYDFLTKEAQSLFLFCSIFEEDKVIEIDLLWRYLVGLDFFQDVYTMEEVRNRVHTLVNTLKDSCFLLEYNTSGTFKMHDVIRDVAIYIADKEENMLTIRSLEGPEKWEDSFGIALFNVDFAELPERFGCPQLKFIFLGGKKYFSQPIPNNVFEGMKELRVLVLIESRLPHPSSISCLDNLQSLALLACELEDVALIGELRNLRALTLSHSNIMRAIFSKERTHEIQVNHDIRTDIIYFTKLRSLYLQNLPNFMGFHPDVDSQLLFNEKVAFSNLEEIYIEGIDNLKMLWHNHQLVPDSFCKIKKLHVGNCKNLMNIFPPNMVRRLQNLEELTIKDCNSVEEVFEVGGENVDKICDTGSTQLRHLTLNNLPKLKHVWTSDPEAILTFQNLHRVEVSKCETLKSLFPISVAKHLKQLERLSINDCELMEEIVALKERLESTTKFVFPRITSLRLELLLELKCFYLGKHTSEWPSLKKLIIRKCDKVKIVASNELSLSNIDGLDHRVPVQQPLFCIEKVAFSNLEEIYIEGMDNLKMLWHNHQLVPDSFCKVKELHVVNCKNLMNIFPHNMLRGFRNLEELMIEDCNSVEEVFEVRRENVEEICDKGSTQLRHLTLNNLPKLKHVWTSDPETILTFQNLRRVKVSKCETLKSLFPISVAKHLEQLESLHINDCGLMEEIVALKEGLESMTKFVFPQLTSLSLELLLELECFYPGKHTSEWPSLKKLTIRKCNRVRIVASNELSFPNTDGLGHHVPVQQPLFCIEKHVWTSDPEAILTFQNLREVEVSQCKTLKSLFPISVAKSLEQLGSLLVNGCELMEEIVALEEGLEIATEFVFPRITSLSLELLPELKYFYPGKHTSKWPSLKILKICKCNKVRIVSLNELSFPNTDGLDHHVPVQQPLFLVQKDTFPNLKELNFDWYETMNQTNGRLFGEFFCKLEVLRLDGKDDKLIAGPWVFVEGLRCLKFLSVSNLFFDNEGQHAGTFERLRQLNLYKMPKLMLLWKEQGRAFQNLEILEVSECGGLKNFVPSSMHFRNLNFLSVRKCHGLINLATSSTVKSLVQLKQLDIKECKRMREIVTNEGEGEAGDEICFNQLKYLDLDDLPSLRSFHLGNRTIKFPSLEYLNAIRCPEMKIFYNGVLSMPKLEQVGMGKNLWSVYRKLLPEEDVNSAIKRFWEENYDPCVQQLFTEKTDASTSEAAEKNGVDNLEDDLKED